MVQGLDEVIARLRRRLRWALEQIRRLNAVREKEGTLGPEDDALFKRCDALVKRLKGTARRTRREAEGYDDVNTFGVLAAEGFLPGYGLEVGTVLGTAEIPFWRTGAIEFTLPRTGRRGRRGRTVPTPALRRRIRSVAHSLIAPNVSVFSTIIVEIL